MATLRPNGSGGVNVFYVHTDHLSTPRKITRPSDDAIVWRWDSDPFGVTGPNQNPSGLGAFAYNLRFPGQYADPETGLNYNYYRDYDPSTGRYVQSDPIGLSGGINTYAYTKNSPTMSTDPTGLDPASGPATGPRQPVYPGIPSHWPFDFGSDQTRDAANAIVDFVNKAGRTIKKLCTLSDDADCEAAEETCFERCQDQLGKGGRTNQGNPYRNCWVRCMKEHGCYKGDSPVE